MKSNRRSLRFGTLVTAVLLAVTTASAGVAGHRADADPTLRSLANRSGLRAGTAVDMAALANDATYRERIATEFSASRPRTS